MGGLSLSVEPTVLDGVYILEAGRHRDERGSISRLFCDDIYDVTGIEPGLAQINLTTNRLMGTLRGMHLQTGIHGETKTVTCVAGAIYDVVLDLRETSLTYGGWIGVDLTAENGRIVVMPPGCAHGFITLTNNAQLLYMVSERFAPDHQTGVRWNDAAFGIEWPMEPVLMSERDRSFPLVRDGRKRHWAA
ncbi:MAG: dTDP-4-dehydrorhamnose 3,5-epimerase family protein [Geminicoccaceae bacterium]